MRLAFNPKNDSVIVAGEEISPNTWHTVDENNPKVRKAIDSGKIVLVDVPTGTASRVNPEVRPLLDEVQPLPDVAPLAEQENSQDAEVRNTGSKPTQRGSAKKTSKE